MKPDLATRPGIIPGSQLTTETQPRRPRSASLSRQRLLFLGAALLFAAWLGWLGYLAWATRATVVLSRPQFLVSALDVVVALERVEKGDQELTIKQVLWSATDEGRKLAGARLTVTNLDRCAGWTTPGDYILPLIPDGPGRYQVPPTPRSPGFEPDPSRNAGRPHIYPATPETLRQAQAMPKP